MELGNLPDLAEAAVALARQEFRLAHAWCDFAKRDDKKWLELLERRSNQRQRILACWQNFSV